MRALLPLTTSILALAGIQAATAQTVVIERDRPSTVVVDRPAAESRTVETRESADGCRSKTVTTDTEDGERRKVSKETCD